MADSYFTLEQAQELVGWLEESFAELRPLTRELNELNDRIYGLEGRVHSNGGSSVEERLTGDRRDRDRISGLIERHIQPILKLGILIKNIQPGLVDFPCMREGREVYLCWHAGESDIRFWHEVESGFAGRQSL